MSDGKSNGDDGVVTSAPASAVGSLLTDLLNEAKQEVQRESADLDRQLQSREEQERLERQRAEARKREELQRKLIEETRKRNEALTRKEKAEQASRQAVVKEKKHDSLLMRLQGAADDARAQAKKTRMILLGVLVLVLVGGGTAAALILTAPPGMELSAYSSVTDDITREIRIEFLELKNQEAVKRLEAEKARLDGLLASAKSAEEKAKLLEQQKKAAEALLQAKEAEALQSRKHGRRKGHKRGRGAPKINLKGVF